MSISWKWRTIVTFLFILRVNGQEEDEQEGNLIFESNSHGNLVLSIPGVPGEDYPVYGQVPRTSFSCKGKINGGLYADPETECQIFHICGVSTINNVDKFSFFCPSGTIFNQDHLICDWWFNVDCSLAESLYSRNKEKPHDRKREKKSLKKKRIHRTTSTTTNYYYASSPHSDYVAYPRHSSV
ncbi:uncharacterized protein [Lepeophtheirus salmonis]|uniref:uncharacterized protein n=1 Tax=Lepeophtheirus salmonis TaxID=72036 RepID=UPI001AE50458|nr:uncharacterized protein LOC121114749 [Lepeophtheirus salmonis]